ncbi:hypothetical protein H4R20_006853 [Coemansia guatemalensis]|uniref:Uncharacterized protein n=1 Tax=Coemansia guatemalensis TaxID=2761395 RepID=A0A9W8HTY6_9FUNG|nr:hypothetical protein H4R20_006853 [Coemansia guatemalensis]
MMQHYRTHLSSKSRRNASPRKVVFVEQPGDPYRRPASGMYSAQVFAGSHPIQHHQQHHPYGPPPSSAPPLRSHPRAPISPPAGRPHYALPSSVHMPRGPAAVPGPPAPPRNFPGAAMSKHSPAVAHPGSMAFY